MVRQSATFSLEFPSEEIEAGATVSFHLSGKFTVNSISTNYDHPERFSAQTPIYEGTVLYSDKTFSLRLESDSLAGSLTLSSGGQSVEADIFSLDIRLGRQPQGFGPPVATWTITFDVDSKDYAFVDYSITNGEYVVADVALSGLLTIVSHTNPDAVDLLEVMSGSFASFTGTQQLQAEGAVIPEPASAAVLAGVGVLGLVAARRRRS